MQRKSVKRSKKIFGDAAAKKLHSFFRVWILSFLAITSYTSQAAEAVVGPVTLDGVSILSVASYGHFAGNLEIAISGGIQNLNGVTCDQFHIATRNTVESFDELVAILLAAHATDRPVLLGISDDPSISAFPGRCSLLFAQIQK